MHILYDGQIYSLQSAGGISRYFGSLIRKLPNNFFPAITASPNLNKTNINYPYHTNLKIIFNRKFKFRPSRLSAWIEQQYYKIIPLLNPFDVIHPTYYSLLKPQEISKYRSPIVLTVWDMINELFPEQTDPYGQLAEEKRRALFAAQAIICISENTKKDLLNRYPWLENKVTVTYLASEIDASLSHGSELVPSRPYYLYVGSRASYKNFDGLLVAFAKAASVQSDVALCVVGPPFDKAEEKWIADFQLSDRIEHYGYVSDRHLAKLYRCSVAFVYPSLYEGFGIPPLEAMSCGTVVVASNCSSIPEVVGDAALLFDPKSTGDLADILLSLLENSTERECLISQGYQRTQEFSWDKTVAQTLDVYKSVIE